MDGQTDEWRRGAVSEETHPTPEALLFGPQVNAEYIFVTCSRWENKTQEAVNLTLNILLSFLRRWGGT